MAEQDQGVKADRDKKKKRSSIRGSDIIADIESRALRIFVSTVRAITLIARDAGIPMTSFAVGVVLLAKTGFDSNVDARYRILSASVLTLAGIISHLWIYSREHQKDAPDLVSDQLQRMTKIVEQSVKEKRTRKPG